MSTGGRLSGVRPFSAPKTSLGSLDAESAARLIAAAADVALVVDRKGVIRDLALNSEELAGEDCRQWLGQPWAKTVTVESRGKVEALLRDATAGAQPTWRQVNHPSPQGVDVPILYSAIQVGREGRVIAVGRNLRAVSTLQQRLVEAQQSLERDYARLRHSETRYRLLFQMTTEAILMVDAAGGRIVEANPAAGRLLGTSGRQLVGRTFPDGFDARSTRALQTLLQKARTSARGEEVRAKLADGKREFLVDASLFRQDNASYLLVRLAPTQGMQAPAATESASVVLRALDASPDGFVVTEPDGRVLSANRAFLDFVQLAAGEQARGRSLDDWFGRPGADLSVLLANLRQHGSVRLFATTLRGELGLSTEVEISAVSVDDIDEPRLGFSIRGVGRRLASAAPRGRQLPRSVEQLTELIGRVPLKDIVRETADVIEKLCIEAALELTGDNRASAAEMLGLSRQSLYVKLHRFGMGERDQRTTG
jgi:transcriptional regulator PpsR